MALDVSILKDGFRSIGDPLYIGFTEWPESLLESSFRHAEVLGEYIEQMTPATTGVVLAKQAFINIHSTSTLQSQDGLTKFVLALIAFANEIALTLPGFVGIPPTGQVFLEDFHELGVDNQSSAEFMSQLLAERIDTWIKTGTATPISGGLSVNWS